MSYDYESLRLERQSALDSLLDIGEAIANRRAEMREQKLAMQQIEDRLTLAGIDGKNTEEREARKRTLLLEDNDHPALADAVRESEERLAVDLVQQECIRERLSLLKELMRWERLEAEQQVAYSRELADVQ